MNIIDEFNNEDERPPINPIQIQQPIQNIPANTQKKEEDIFTITKADYKIQNVKEMAVSNNILILALVSPCKIVRMNLASQEEPEVISISSSAKDKIHKIFLDPSGKHLIISLESEVNYYLPSIWEKPQVISKMKGVLIESVGWNRENRDPTTTKEILIGNSKGRIYETSILATQRGIFANVMGGSEPVLKLIYNFGEPIPVTGLRLDEFPIAAKESRKFSIIAITPNRLYQFIGGPTLEEVFAPYEDKPKFSEVPGHCEYSEIVFFSKYQGLPKSFAWLTGSGVMTGEFAFGSQGIRDSVISDTSLHQLTQLPISVVITEFHIILLFPHSIRAISVLTSKVIWEETLPERLGPVRGLCYDPIERTLWMYTPTIIFEIIITREDRDVWKMYLEKKQFELALNYCKGNPQQQNIVHMHQGDHFFEKKLYKQAAKAYGKTQQPFEEIALKFLTVNDSEALKNYVENKLDAYAKAKKDQFRPQMTLLATWLTELHLDKLTQIKESSEDQNLSYSEKKEMFEFENGLHEEFCQFLTTYSSILDPATTFKLISSHGRTRELLHFAMEIREDEKVVEHYIREEQYAVALEYMKKHNVSEEIYYKFSPTLMHNEPWQTTTAWEKIADRIDPTKLIPALMRYDVRANPPEYKGTNLAISYLERVIKQGKNTDESIHNCLISLYVKEPKDDALLQFLSQEERYFDLKYALRLCMKAGKTQACVLIYAALELYEEAVELALDVDIELAKQFAGEVPEDDSGLKKKLWLRIARHVVEDQRDIKKGMDIVTECDKLIQIEDILPFFPDFTEIDTFQNEICTSLQDYNKHIEDLKAEMKEATTSAEHIRRDIKELRNRFGYVPATRKCDLCGVVVLSRGFYLFPCNHVFHADCLRSEVTSKYLNATEKRQVKSIMQELSQIAQQQLPTPVNFSDFDSNNTLSNLQNNNLSNEDQLRDELDNLIASDCIFCGEFMIQSLSKSFVTLEDDVHTWML